jgi:hypothetical protein
MARRSPDPGPSKLASEGRVVNLRHGLMPEGAVYIGRAQRGRRLKASKWANPYSFKRESERAEVIARYEHEHLPAHPELVAALSELRGKTLACWCAPKPCHGDVLVRLANGESDEQTGDAPDY